MLSKLQLHLGIRARPLVSLFDCAFDAAIPALEQQRWASSAAQEKSVKFAKDRKSHNADLSQLRKSWAQELKEKAERQAAEAEAAAALKTAAKSQRAREDAVDKEARRRHFIEAQQVAKEERARAKQERLRRQELRWDILDAARSARKEALLHNSCHWVDADSLDARVQEALDNTVPLWPEEKQQQKQR